MQAGLSTIAVVVAADEASSDEATVQRLVGQYAKNEHRTGLSNAERVDVFAQMAAFGVSATKIAKRTKTKKAEVDAALTVANSDLAKVATARHDWLTLGDAAVLAEYEDDPDAVEQLVAAAEAGRFAHVAQRLRNDREERRAREQFIAHLTDAGMSVVETDHDTAVPLYRLLDTEGGEVTELAHRECPGRAVQIRTAHGYVDPTTGQPPACHGCGADAQQMCAEDCTAEDDEDREDDTDVVWRAYPTTQEVCIDPEDHGHTVRRYDANPYGQEKKKAAEMSEDERAAASAARRDTIESNKAWAAAEPVRREWLTQWATRKTLPKGAGAFLASTLATDPDPVTRIGGNHLAATLLGHATGQYGRSSDLTAAIAKASDTRAQVITLLLVLAGYEDSLSREDWRTVRESPRRYLTYLASLGYPLSDVERRACGEEPLTT